MSEPKVVLCVFGTRPEAIKFAPVIRALADTSGLLVPRVCVTNQHGHMLDQVLDYFSIDVHHSLEIMTEGQTLSEIGSRILDRLPTVLEAERPAALLVQGDTTTAFAAALAAFHENVPVGHIEAGLRTYQKDSPFPEELNRQMTTLLSEWHFAPTQRAVDVLAAERVASDKIILTGNPIIDALEWTVANCRNGSHIDRLSLDDSRRLILVTAHRRESFGQPFMELCTALRALVDRNPEVELVYPVHLNPRVQEPVRAILGESDRIHLIEPVDYVTLVSLMQRSYLILTDSGGIQEEAPSLGKPVLVMRETTERPEGVDAGTALLVGTSHDSIVEHAERLLSDSGAYRQMSEAHNPFGDGHAAERIAAVLTSALCSSAD